MKVLRFSQYIMVPKYKEHNRTSSGYGRSVWDISRYSAKIKNEEFLYTYANKNEIYEEKVCIVKGNLWEIIKAFNTETFQLVIKTIYTTIKLKGVLPKKKLSLIYHSFKYIYIIKKIKELKPEIIHIHGLTHSTYYFIKAAHESGIPFIVTLHGLNLNVTKNKVEQDFEVKMIEELNLLGIYITVIGSGMAKTINERCILTNPRKINTVNHGIDEKTFNLNLNKSELRKNLGINDKKIILSVGSLSERRNQITLVRAVSLLTEEEINKLRVFIIGEGPMRTTLELEIKKLDLENTVFLLGEKNHIELSKFYSIADVTVVLSKVEGFGRPILESLLFGVPVVAFDDLDAVHDLYKPGCLYLIKRRDIKEVRNKIIEVLKLKVDTEGIKNYALTKTWTESVNQYQKIYKKSIEEFYEK